jgi:hypothetical protein
MSQQQNTNQKTDNNLVIGFKDFHPEQDITFAKVKLNSKGGKNVGIMNAKAKRVLHLSAPLTTTWGVNKRVNDNGQVSYDLSIQFPNPTSPYFTQEEADFLEQMKEVERLAKEHVRKNCRELLNKAKLSEEGMDLLWNSIFYYPRKVVDSSTNPPLKEPDYSRPPTMRIKLPFYGEEFDSKFAIYDINNMAEPLFPNPQDDSITPETLMPSGNDKPIATKFIPVIKAGGIYFTGSGCGMTWRLYQAVIKPRVSNVPEGCVVQVPDSMREQLVSSTEQEESDNQATESNVTSTVVEDSDEEEEEEEVEPVREPTPEPAPVKTKKKVVRKKAN